MRSPLPTPVDRAEGRAVWLAAAGFFCLMCGYYMLRPIREAMALEVGRERIQILFTAVLLVSSAILPLYWWVVARIPRRWLLTIVYLPFTVLFAGLAAGLTLNPGAKALAFVYFVTLSSFNLFLISVFWSSMADVWRPEAAKRLFGYVAGGGSAGALLGPLLVNASIEMTGPTPLILLACGFILLTILLVGAVRLTLRTGHPQDRVPDRSEVVGGRAIDDMRRLIRTPYMLGIAALIIAGQTIGAFMYSEQARYVESAYASLAERAALFSRMEIAVSLLALFFQVVVVGWLTRIGSLRTSLSAMPILIGATFVLLALFPLGAVLLVTQVIRRAADYGLGKPPREVLFTVLAPESKFKSKSLIDTVLQRGADAASQWLYTAIAGLGLAGIAWVCAGISLLLVQATRSLAGAFEQRSQQAEPAPTPAARASAQA
ncbi:MAG TPA: MFS transporter [Steroidobacteraceae bacterium]|nr:MFS transporter [Steroidobacteraceae bacterium]